MITTIGDLFNFINSENINLIDEDIKVKTRYGFKKVLACDITEKDAKPIQFFLENGYSLTCSKDHKIGAPRGIFKKASSYKKGQSIQTDMGPIAITEIHKINSKIDLLDLQVEEVHEYYTNRIVSHNSTIADVISLATFGKAKNKALSEVVNEVNKKGGGYTGIDFESNGKVVSIDRNFSPNKLDLVVDGEKYDVASKKDTQDYVEGELLDFNYYVFSNIISLSILDFKSFLKMEPKDKRLIIDKVFSLSILNEMKEELKKTMKLTNTEMLSIDSDISSYERNIQRYNQELENLKILLKTNNDSKIEAIKEQIEKINEHQETVLASLQKVETAYKSLKSKNDELYSEVLDIKSLANAKRKEIKLYDQDKCGTCGSDLTTDYHKNLKHEIESQLKQHEKDCEDIETTRLEYVEKIKVMKEKVNKLQEVSSRNTAEVSSLNRELRNLKVDKVDPEQTQSITKLINEAVETKELKVTEKSKVENKIKFYSIVERMLGDKGVKQIAISNIVPSLNYTINLYLEKFGLDFYIEFNQDFESKIFNHGVEKKVGSFSAGEQMILDFVVLITIIKLLKTKYTSLNMIFLDEVFANLDLKNTNTVIRILKELSVELKLNIYVIHFNLLDNTNFDTIIEVNKEKVFSDIKIREGVISI